VSEAFLAFLRPPCPNEIGEGSLHFNGVLELNECAASATGEGRAPTMIRAHVWKYV
jgi:hypothetical protein